MTRMTDEPETWTTTEPSKSRLPWILVGIAVLIVIAALAGVWAYTSDSANPERGAKQACEKFVTERLKAPATAKFTDGAAVSQNTVGAYVVSGEVDAENGFGAMIRTAYSCTVTPDGDGWELHNLDGLGE